MILHSRVLQTLHAGPSFHRGFSPLLYTWQTPSHPLKPSLYMFSPLPAWCTSRHWTEMEQPGLELTLQYVMLVLQAENQRAVPQCRQLSPSSPPPALRPQHPHYHPRQFCHCPHFLEASNAITSVALTTTSTLSPPLPSSPSSSPLYLLLECLQWGSYYSTHLV